MSETATETKTAQLAGLIYKNMKMGAESIIDLLPKVEDEKMRSRLTEQLDGYEKYAKRAKDTLDKEGVEAKEENVMSKMGAKMGISMKTMVDSTSSHIAEIMMGGSSTAIAEMTRLLRNFENTDASEDMLSLTREIINFENNNFNKNREYL